jgi:hypothetical protein
MAEQVVIQFSTTAHNTCKLRWQNRWSEIIRRAGHTQFSHSDLELDDGSLVGASNSPEAPVIRGNPNGVAVRPPNYQLFGYRRRMVLETPRAKDIENLWLSQVGKDFDTSFIWDFASDKWPGSRDWRLTDRWVCAEGITWSMETAGFWADDFPDGKLPWPKNRVSPTDLLLVLLTDPRWINRDTFWEPVPGLKLDPGEV